MGLSGPVMPLVPPTSDLPPDSAPPAPRRQHQPRLPAETFAGFERAVLLVGAEAGCRVSNSEAMEALAEMLAVDRPFAGVVARHMTQRSVQGIAARDRHKTTVRISAAAGDALEVAVQALGRSLGREVTTNDAMEALAEVLPADRSAPGRLARYLEAKTADLGAPPWPWIGSSLA